MANTSAFTSLLKIWYIENRFLETICRSHTIRDFFMRISLIFAIIGIFGLPLLCPVEMTLYGQIQTDSPELPNTQSLLIPQTPPTEALKMLSLPNGFEATLFAAEPDVNQPIAMTTDARGRLWVAECNTYSDRKENFNTDLNDRILILEDTNADGTFDKKTVFWDQAKKLTSIEVGFGGVWLTAAPNLMFIPDANQDDIPDAEPIVLLNGFEGDVIRHNIVNGLRWGPDGWLYGRHGIQATSFVGSPGATESQRIPMNCAIWRFHPTDRTFEIVAQGGTNPWGFDFDEHGEMFMINTVIGHLFHIVPNARYQRMYGAHFNPHLYQLIDQTADHFHWDVSEEHWAAGRNKNISDGTDQAGGGHAHTGLMIYQGNQWPKAFHNQLFTANFHGRRVNSDSIHRAGNSYVAHHGKDYFKSADPWFRGIELIYGRAGEVYLADWSDIGECHENDGIHRTSGRIFRITYGDSAPPVLVNVAESSIDQLIHNLSHPNEWVVRKSRRRLQELTAGEIKNPSSVPPTFALNESILKDHLWIQKFQKAFQLAGNTKTKLRIMWAYYSCFPNQESWLLQRLSEPNEHLRAWAVRLLTDGRISISDSGLERILQTAQEDESGLVRLYLASSIPRFDPDFGHRLTAELAKKSQDASDRVQPKLIWYGYESIANLLPNRAVDLAFDSNIPLLSQNIARRLTFNIQSAPQTVDKLTAKLRNQSPEKIGSILLGMTEALKGWNQAPAPQQWTATKSALSTHNDPKINRMLEELDVVFGTGRTIDELKSIANDGKNDIATRRRAIITLANSPKAPELFKFFRSHLNNKAFTTVVVQAMVKCDTPAAAQAILNRYPHMDPEGKSTAINTLVTRKSWAEKLLHSIATQNIKKSVISASHARQISNFNDSALTSLLESNWGSIRSTSAENEEKMNQLKTKIASAQLADGSRGRGMKIYEEHCASCHIMFGRGGKIGPDLTGSDRKNINYLLENILAPNASVAQNYQVSVIVLDDGRFLSGVIVNENQRTLSLQTKDSLMTIDLTTVDERRETKDSLMPSGILNPLTDSEVIDLFSFLSQ
ncbi:c-type cytochrome [Mariniblastus sp.]|nr:c-type cytochrome [Mariniblastus sp.]